MDYNSVRDMADELSRVIMNMQGYHSTMNEMKHFYQTSAFYRPENGASMQKQQLKANLLKVFADKNIHYTCREPIVKVATTGASPEQRLAASIREKIIYAVRRKSGMAIQRRKQAFDGTVFSAAISETGWDQKRRCAFVKRYDPRFCYWQMSNDNEPRVVAFWAVFPITLDEAEKSFGVSPKTDYLAKANLLDDYTKVIDGKRWFTMVIRWDEEVRTSWIGDAQVEKPHKHMMGGVPIDAVFPFEEANQGGQGAFFLDPLVPLQAELNELIRQRAVIAKRHGNPTLWGRGILNKQKDGIVDTMSTVGGGFVGLGANGELGLVQVNDTRMIDEHEKSIVRHMMRISGFGEATFGETLGANTSGDALGMYYTPTERLIESQNIAWNAFDESINAKILRCYDKFGGSETFKLDGYAPAGTVLGIGDDEKHGYQSGGFEIEFDRTVIDGNYNNKCFPGEVTPKNEIANNRFWLDAAKQQIISRTTAYEKMGIQSPEDELELLKAEQMEPSLNPDGMQKLMAGAAPYLNPQLPTPQPAPRPMPARV